MTPKKLLPPEETNPHSFSNRWHPAIRLDGFTQVSNFFLENYHRLHPFSLTHGEAMFVIHLMQYKWTSDAPFPAYKTIAARMGVSSKTARRFAQSLETKGYLVREMRIGETNRFHLNKLMAALSGLKEGKKKRLSLTRKGRTAAAVTPQ